MHQGSTSPVRSQAVAYGHSHVVEGEHHPQQLLNVVLYVELRDRSWHAVKLAGNIACAVLHLRPVVGGWQSRVAYGCIPASHITSQAV